MMNSVALRTPFIHDIVKYGEVVTLSFNAVRIAFIKEESGMVKAKTYQFPLDWIVLWTGSEADSIITNGVRREQALERVRQVMG